MAWKSYAGASGSFRGGASVGSGYPANAAAAAPQAGTGPGGWHPTILYMVGLIIAEIVIVGILSRTLLR
jgi:hypothetical protein